MPPAAWGRCLRELKPLLHLDTIDVDRPHPRRAAGRAGGLGGPGGDPALRRSGLAGGRARGAERKPRAGRRHLQARGRHAGAVRERRPGGRVHRARGPRRPHRRSRRSTCSRTTSWCCRTSARTRPGCRRPAICRSRRSWRRPGSRTWCASRTGACRGRPSARSCCTSRRRRRSAARSRRCATATASGCRSANKRIDLLVDEGEIARRLGGAFSPRRRRSAATRRSIGAPLPRRPKGCDFDFLTGERAS